MRTATTNLDPAIHLGGCGAESSVFAEAFLAFALSILCASTAQAQVTRLEILSRDPLNGGQPAGEAGPYEIIRGKIHGEVDPADRHNRIIQDLDLARRNSRGKVEYVATFALAKPVDLARASGTLVYQVVNRITFPGD